MSSYDLCQHIIIDINTEGKNASRLSLTAKDGRGQVLHAGDGGGQAGHDAHDPVVEGGVRGHSQDGRLVAGHLLAFHHHSEAQAEEVGPSQCSHHPAAQEPAERQQTAG